MRSSLRFGSVLLGLAATGYFVVFASRAAARHDPGSISSGPMVFAIVLAAVGCASIILTSSWAWGRLLRGAGVQVPTLRLNVIMGLTQVGKYVPGNVGHHLGRTAMSIQWGIPARALFATLLAETLLAMAAAVVVGVLGLAVAGRGTATLPRRLPEAAALAALGLTIALVALLVAIRGAPRLVRRLALHLPATGFSFAAGGRALGAAFAAYVLNFIVIGVGFYVIAFAAIRIPLAAAPLFVGAFALSWIVGFLVPGAPAGLGVREGIMAALIATPLHGDRALEIIVAFRVATTLGDLLGLAWGASLYVLERRTAARVVAVPPGTDPQHGPCTRPTLDGRA